MSLGQTTRALTRNAKKRFVGANDAALRQFVLLQVNIALDHPTSTIKDDELIKLADAAFEKAVVEGEAWAVSLKNSYRDNVIKPLVDKAREKGVDPVPVIVMQTDLTEEQASDMVAALDADGASEGDGDDIEFDMDALGADVDAGADNALASAV